MPVCQKNRYSIVYSYFFCRVHVVFGHVINGTEVVKEIENQKTNNQSCPIEQVRVANCGELVLQMKPKGKQHMNIYSQVH